jgi:hypothetical protein
MNKFQSSVRLQIVILSTNFVRSYCKCSKVQHGYAAIISGYVLKLKNVDICLVAYARFAYFHGDSNNWQILTKIKV